MICWVRNVCLVVLLTASIGLVSGCGTVATSALSASSASAAPASEGTASSALTVHGRAQAGPLAIAGSHIYMFAANTSGYGSPSLSLLFPTAPGVAVDALGAYVTTDSSGGFYLGESYRCAPHQLVYILGSGGRAVGTDAPNPALALVSLLGVCPDKGNFTGVVQFINISEVSTVASVYALAGFMTDGSHLSSAPTAKSAQGMTNAFLTASSIFDATTGRVLAETPTGSGIVPQAEINSLANVIAPCVDSYRACSSLFSYTRDTDGNNPPDTISALLNIVHNPGANVAGLFALAKTQPFQPALAAAPNDWTVAITFFAENLAGGYYPAFDSAGNLWVPGYANNTLTEFDPLGNILSGRSGYSGGGLSQPFSVAIDSHDNAWVTNYGAGTVGGPSVSEFSASGLAVTTNGFTCGAGCNFLAIDTLQNLWVSGSPQVETLRSTGTPVSTFSTNTFASGVSIDSRGRGWVVGQGRNLFRLTLPSHAEQFNETVSAASGIEVNPVAIDSNDSVWFASSKMNAIGEHDLNGAPVSPSGGFTGGGLSGPSGLAIDGANTVWVANRDGNSISAFAPSGVPISGSKGYRAIGISNPRGIAVDGSGNVWIANFTSNSVTEFLGVATPAVTPITPGSHGQRP